MSVAKELQKLEVQRDGELARLRTQFATVIGALQSEPVRLIQEHPYLSTGGAALMGFAAAQMAMRIPLPVAHSPQPPIAAPPAAPKDAAPARSILAEILPLILDLAGQFLSPVAEAPAPATFTQADAGTVRGKRFPIPPPPRRRHMPASDYIERCLFYFV